MMGSRNRIFLWIAIAVAGLCAVASCGKKEEKKTETKAQSLKDIVAMASGDALQEETGELHVVIEGGGFSGGAYVTFPSQEVGKKARMMLYTGKNKGGMIYVKKTASGVLPSWHWYFDDMEPERVEQVEINEDGLWDVRVTAKGGKVVELIQDETFTLFAKERPDWIAMNGGSSAPASDEDVSWKCFDGDTATAWRSSLETNEKVYLDILVPFGVEQGVLTLRTMDRDQPERCEVYVGDQLVQTFGLEPAAAVQVVKLADGVKGARKVRLVFDSTHGEGDIVAISELALR